MKIFLQIISFLLAFTALGVLAYRLLELGASTERIVAIMFLITINLINMYMTGKVSVVYKK